MYVDYIRNVKFNMFITAVCVLFFIELQLSGQSGTWARDFRISSPAP